MRKTMSILSMLAFAVIGTSVPAVAQTPIVDTVSYSYDELGRLITVTHSGTVNNNVQATYVYDKANNRTQVTVTGASH
jgi:YD repeat-containing protein